MCTKYTFLIDFSLILKVAICQRLYGLCRRYNKFRIKHQILLCIKFLTRITWSSLRIWIGWARVCSTRGHRIRSVFYSTICSTRTPTCCLESRLLSSGSMIRLMRWDENMSRKYFILRPSMLVIFLLSGNFLTWSIEHYLVVIFSDKKWF